MFLGLKSRNEEKGSSSGERERFDACVFASNVVFWRRQDDNQIILAQNHTSRRVEGTAL
jgi:hypothetical protein